MRSVLSLAVLALLAPVLAVPMFERDPASIHTPARAEAADADTLAVAVADAPPQPAEDACDAVCGLRHLEGAESERDALCSEVGLSNTLECALCIDTTWAETTWEDSALAEYERIVEACKNTDKTQL